MFFLVFSHIIILISFQDGLNFLLCIMFSHVLFCFDFLIKNLIILLLNFYFFIRTFLLFIIKKNSVYYNFSFFS